MRRKNLMRSILQLGSSVFAAAFAVLLLLGIATTASAARTVRLKRLHRRVRLPNWTASMQRR